MARFEKVRRVTLVEMELDAEDADFLLFFLDKARTQMMNDGSNTEKNMTALNQIERGLVTVMRGE